MKRLSPILLFAVFVWAQARPGAAQEGASPAPATPQNPPSSTESAPALPVDLENARKAKALLDHAIQSLGVQAYLNVRDLQLTGRTYSFHHGRPTSNGIQFWRFIQYPDEDRIELTKERDVAQLYNGDKGYEITYKGPRPMEEKDLADYLRRRRFSLETVLRTWVNSPGVALFYEGNANAAEHPALQVSLIN